MSAAASIGGPDAAEDDDLFPTPAQLAAEAFHEAGLLLPPLPRGLVDMLEQVDAMHFATGDDDPADREEWLRQARAPGSPDGVAFGQLGHGLANWTLFYRLITPGLAVFLRQSYGGIHGDRDADAKAFNEAVEQLEELVVLSGAAARSGRLKAGQRLVVAIDGPEDSGWETVPDGEWHPSTTPIAQALRSLTAAR